MYAKVSFALFSVYDEEAHRNVKLCGFHLLSLVSCSSKQVCLVSHREDSFLLLQEAVSTSLWRLQHMQEDQDARLAQEEAAIERYQENAQLLAKLFTPSEQEIKRGRWEGLGEESMEGPADCASVDIERAGAESGAVRDIISRNDEEKSGMDDGKMGEGQGWEMVGVAACLSRAMMRLHSEESTGQVERRRQALLELQNLAGGLEGDVVTNERAHPVSPRKGKRKVESQMEATTGAADSFAQLLVDAGNVSSCSEIEECENAYRQAYKRICRLPRLPEGEDKLWEDLWPSFGKQCFQVRLDNSENNDLRKLFETVSTCQL
jgi:hypothetical protein